MTIPLTGNIAFSKPTALIVMLPVRFPAILWSIATVRMARLKAGIANGKVVVDTALVSSRAMPTIENPLGTSALVTLSVAPPVVLMI